MTSRLFIAIPLSQEIKAKLLTLIKPSDSYRITKIENFHITLLFLGDTPDDVIDTLKKRLEAVLKGFKSFETDISFLGQFPPNGKPKIIYASGKKHKADLENLANSVRTDFSKLGFIDNHEFKYHITLARAKDDYIEEKIPLLIKNDIMIKVSEVSLFKSILTEKGPVYEKVFFSFLKN